MIILHLETTSHDDIYITMKCMHICVCYKKSIKTRFDFCSEMFQKILTRNNEKDLQQLIDLFFLQPKICNLLSQKEYEQNL